MPHKVNPIDFENAEGNLGLANAVLEHLARKLPISRWQRDLTDSTVLRNIGVGIGYGLVAYQSLLQGLKKITICRQIINRDLDGAWVLLAEPIQTMMRKHGLVGGYEQMKMVFRGGREVSREQVWGLIDSLEELPWEVRRALKGVTPANYIGMADSW
jgi:adenylosuccinate lyase